MKKVKLLSLIEKPITGEWGSEGNSIPVLRTTNFSNEGRLNLKDIVYRDIDLKKVESKKLKNGDIIIEKSGGSPTQPVGRVVYFDLEGTFLCNNFTSILRPKKDIIQSKYLLYQLFASHKFGFTNNYQNKTTGIINLKLERYIKELEIPLPPLPTQQKIAEILDTADQLRQYNKQLIEKYEALTQSLFLEMFGDPVRNEKGWKKMELKKFGKIITGNTPPRNDDENYSSDFIEWLKTDNINDKYINVTAAKEYLSEKGFSKARFVENGALLVACIAGSIQSIGRASLTNRKVSFNQQINAIQPFDDVNPNYLYFLFKISKKHIQNHASNGMKRMLTKGEFEKILMIKPSLDLQNKFSERVQMIETQKQQAQEALAKSEDLFQSLLQRAFKGELN
jgi:type I restriction enzyme S subunit